MMNDRCLACCEPLKSGSGLYHRRCSESFFGAQEPPELPYEWQDLNALAEEAIRARVSVPGVQPKISLHLDRSEGEPGRFTLVGLWGDFVLKPPHEKYPGMPELEHTCMSMARACGIDTVPFALLPLRSGEPAFLSRRVDRREGEKLHMEDMAQLTGKMTEQKYRGSLEQVAKAVWLHSSTPLLDAVRLFELALFCFLTGNSDMHLKNFSLLHEEDGRIRLAPAYDLLATQILLPADREESALSIRGKRAKLSARDFRALADGLRLTPKQYENACGRILESLPEMETALARSFAKAAHKDALGGLMRERLGRIDGGSLGSGAGAAGAG
jgi:serine/threonine-protein kinase HipA